MSEAATPPAPAGDAPPAASAAGGKAPLVSISPMGATVLLVCLERTAVTLGTMTLKASIAAKLDTLKGPEVAQWTKTGDEAPTPIYVPETGAGYEKYRVLAGMLALEVGEAQHLRDNFNAIMGDKGFPSKFVRGVAEIDAALRLWAPESGPKPAKAPAKGAGKA